MKRPFLVLRHQLLQVVVNLLVLRKVTQLGDVVEHSLQVIVADLALERGNQRAGFFGRVAAKRACVVLQSALLHHYLAFPPNEHTHLQSNSSLTQLRPLKLRQLRQRLRLAGDLLHGLAALEAREGGQVGVVLVDQVVVGQWELGVLGAGFLDAREQLVGGGGAEGCRRGHLAELEVGGGFFVAGGLGAAARGLRELGLAGHGCGSCDVVVAGGVECSDVCRVVEAEVRAVVCNVQYLRRRLFDVTSTSLS